MAANADEIIKRLRDEFKAAVLNRRGVSFMLTDEETELVSHETIMQLENETGYRKMVSHNEKPHAPVEFDVAERPSQDG